MNASHIQRMNETVLVSGVFVLRYHLLRKQKTTFAARGNPIHFDVAVHEVVYP